MVEIDKKNFLLLPEHVYFKFDHVFVAIMIKNVTSRIFITTVLCRRSVLAGDCLSLAVCCITEDQDLPVSHWLLEEDLLAGY